MGDRGTLVGEAPVGIDHQSLAVVGGEMTFILILLTVGIVILMAWWVEKSWPKQEPPKEEPKVIVTPPPVADFSVPKGIERKIYSSRPSYRYPDENEDVDRRIRGG
jgi:hypothetical protein